MKVDLHSHTLYSACGKDEPQALVEEMSRQGVAIIGITDHNYGIGERLEEYLRAVRALALRYSKQIRVLCGIEVCTKPQHLLPDSCDLREFD